MESTIPAITRFVRRARARGTSAHALEALAGDRAPDLVRQRAFARVSREVAAGQGRTHGVSRVA